MSMLFSASRSPVECSFITRLSLVTLYLYNPGTAFFLNWKATITTIIKIAASDMYSFLYFTYVGLAHLVIWSERLEDRSLLISVA